jgi:hypothetical protein
MLLAAKLPPLVDPHTEAKSRLVSDEAGSSALLGRTRILLE